MKVKGAHAKAVQIKKLVKAAKAVQNFLDLTEASAEEAFAATATLIGYGMADEASHVGDFYRLRQSNLEAQVLKDLSAKRASAYAGARCGDGLTIMVYVCWHPGRETFWVRPGTAFGDAILVFCRQSEAQAHEMLPGIPTTWDLLGGRTAL